MPAFTTQDNTVHWNCGGRSFRLKDREVEILFGIFEREHAVSEYLDLYEAHLAAGGIPRVSSFRSAA